MKKILFGALIALLAPVVLRAQSPIEIRKPMIYSFESTADIHVPASGGTFSLDFTMRDGWQEEYRDADGLRSFIQQEISEDELFWLTIPSLIIFDDLNHGRITFKLAKGGPRILLLHSASNEVTIYQGVSK